MKPRKLLNVLPECYVDTNLIEFLLDAGVNHQHSCSKVVGQLNTTFADSFAVDGSPALPFPYFLGMVPWGLSCRSSWGS